MKEDSVREAQGHRDYQEMKKRKTDRVWSFFQVSSLFWHVLALKWLLPRVHLLAVAFVTELLKWVTVSRHLRKSGSLKRSCSSGSVPWGKRDPIAGLVFSWRVREDAFWFFPSLGDWTCVDTRLLWRWCFGTLSAIGSSWFCARTITWRRRRCHCFARCTFGPVLCCTPFPSLPGSEWIHESEAWRLTVFQQPGWTCAHTWPSWICEGLELRVALKVTSLLTTSYMSNLLIHM